MSRSWHRPCVSASFKLLIPQLSCLRAVANLFPLVVLTTLQQFNVGLSMAPFPGNYIQWDFGLRHVVTGASHRSVTRFARPGRDAQMDWVAFGGLFPLQSGLSLLVALNAVHSSQYLLSMPWRTSSKSAPFQVRVFYPYPEHYIPAFASWSLLCRLDHCHSSRNFYLWWGINAGFQVPYSGYLWYFRTHLWTGDNCVHSLFRGKKRNNRVSHCWV